MSSNTTPLTDAEDLWLACVCQAPTYADHSLVSSISLSHRAEKILVRIRELHQQGWPMVTADQLEGTGQALHTIPRRLAVVDAPSTIAQAERRLIDAWADEEYLRALREAQDVCKEQGRIAAELYLSRARDRIAAHGSGIKWFTPHEIGARIVERIRRQLRGDVVDRKIESGFEVFDNALKNYKPSRMTTIGGYTSSGKSTIALQLLTGMAMLGTPTALISLEDAEDLTVTRQIAHIIERVEIAVRLCAETTTFNDLRDLHELVHQHMQKIQQQITYLPGATVEQVRYAVQEAIRSGAKAVGVDYLQCFDVDDRRTGLSAAARDLKSASSQLGGHLLLMSQVRRPEDGTSTKRPTMYMFKETGDIENISEYCVLMHRPEAEADVRIERAAAYVDKAKDGGPCVIRMGWDRERNCYCTDQPDNDAGA